jgi:hypothetical protein
MIYRNRKLLDLSHRINDCQFRLPGCQRYSVDGCEPAHSNQQKHGKGKGIKAADDQHVASCPWCHRVYDGQRGFVLPREEANQLFDEARTRTFMLYEKEGWLDQVGYTIEVKEALYGDAR